VRTLALLAVIRNISTLIFVFAPPLPLRLPLFTVCAWAAAILGKRGS